MTYGMTFAEHLTRATSTNISVEVKLCFKKRILGVRVTIAQRKALWGFDTNWLLNNV